MRPEISPRFLNKVFYFNNNGTRKDKKTFKISSIRKLIVSLNINVQLNKRKYEKPAKSISWSDSKTLY